MKNKKLFAILTLVCFMFTLMPVAAFADSSALSEEASIFATVKANAEAEKGDVVVAQVTLKNVGNTNYANADGQAVYVWAETVNGQISDALEIVDETAVTEIDAADAAAVAETGVTGLYKVWLSKGVAVGELELKFLRAGSYTLKATTEDMFAYNKTDVTDITVMNGANSAYTKVAVSNPTAETEFWGVEVSADSVTTDSAKTAFLVDGDESGKLAEDKDLTVQVDANGVKTETVTLAVYAGTEENPAEKIGKNGGAVSGYPVQLDTNSSNIEISTTQEFTNHNGEVEFKVAGLREGTYKVYVTVGDLEVAVTVQVGASIANNIELVKSPSAPVAKDTDADDYADLIRFLITDVNGNAVTDCDDNCVGAPANEDEAAYVTIVEKPAASKLKDKDVYLTNEGEGRYGLTTSKDFDVEGTYTVKAILDNGRSASVTWEVKKFQTPVAIVIDAPETVELGTTADVELTYVDANGVEKLAKKDAELAASGYAIAGLGELNDAVATVFVKSDEKYAGSTIKLTAVSERYNLVSVAEIAVAKAPTDIAFEEDTLAVNVNNKVEWNVVDEDGKAVTLDLGENPTVTINYVVLDKPEDAKVSIYDATEKPFDGDGVMALTSNKVGNVTVQAIVKVVLGADKLDNVYNDLNATQTKYYTGTEIFAVGTEGKGDVVVMSIGSNEIVINDAKGTIDAAPIVENNRTFVPFRALAEAFGATVAYDEATQAVTAELNGVTVVMTIGSAEYTVNGEAATADVAPFINGSRTMVPVRFVAEAFGIKVIPTYDENGATADILFNL